MPIDSSLMPWPKSNVIPSFCDLLKSAFSANIKEKSFANLFKCKSASRPYNKGSFSVFCVGLIAKRCDIAHLAHDRNAFGNARKIVPFGALMY